MLNPTPPTSGSVVDTYQGPHGGFPPETLLTTWQLFSALWSTKPQGHRAPSTTGLSCCSQRKKGWGHGKAVSPGSVTGCVSGRVSLVGGSVTLSGTPLKLLAPFLNCLLITVKGTDAREQSGGLSWLPFLMPFPLTVGSVLLQANQTACVSPPSPVVTEWPWQAAPTVLSSAGRSGQISVMRPRPLENDLAFPAL